jgi:hypothetical protein
MSERIRLYVAQLALSNGRALSSPLSAPANPRVELTQKRRMLTCSEHPHYNQWPAEYRPLGKTSRRVSALGISCRAVGGAALGEMDTRQVDPGRVGAETFFAPWTAASDCLRWWMIFTISIARPAQYADAQRAGPFP